MRLTKKMIWVILLLALGLRSVLLDSSFWLDEAAQVFESARSFQDQFHIPHDFQPPLFHVLVHGMYQISHTEVWLRLVPLLAGLLSIYFLFLLTEEFLFPHIGKRATEVSLIASLFLATSSFHIYFSQELRPYSLSAMWAVISWYALIKILKQDSFRWWAIFSLCSIAGLYTMYIYPFLLIGQYVWLLRQKGVKVKKILVSIVCVGFGFLAWIPSFLEQLRIGSELRHQLPGWSDIVSTPVWKAIPMILAKFAGGVLPVDLNVLTIVGVGIPLLLSALFVITGLRFQKKSQFEFTWILISWLVIPIVLAGFVSIFLPVLSPKRVLFALPAWYLAISFGFVQMKGRWKWLLLGLMVTIQMMSIFYYWQTPTAQRERWKDMSIQLHEQFSPSNTIAIMGWYESFPSWSLYANQQENPIRVLPVAGERVVNESELDVRMKPVEQYTNILVFDYMRDLTDPKRTIESWLEAHGYKGVDSIDSKNFGFIRYYVRQPMLSQRCLDDQQMRY